MEAYIAVGGTIFLSTPSARRATFQSVPFSAAICLFLSTPSARRATHRPQRIPRRGDISIHALREEGDMSSLMNA